MNSNHCVQKTSRYRRWVAVAGLAVSLTVPLSANAAYQDDGSVEILISAALAYAVIDVAGGFDRNNNRHKRQDRRYSHRDSHDGHHQRYRKQDRRYKAHHKARKHHRRHARQADRYHYRYPHRRFTH